MVRWNRSLPLLAALALAAPPAVRAQIGLPGNVGVSVQPTSATTAVTTGASPSYTFTVTNTGLDMATFNLAATCRAPVISCYASTSQVTLDASESVAVSVQYQTGSTAGTATVKLRAVWSGGTAPSATGTLNVQISAPASVVGSAPGVSVASNDGGTLDRGKCYRVSLGAGVEWSCGDFVVAHALPSSRVRGRTRAPTLVYNSGTADRYQIVTADVTLPAGSSPPDSLTAVLTENGAQMARSGWPGSNLVAGQSRRIALEWYNQYAGTRLHDYSLQVTAWYGTTAQPTTVTGQYASVDRVGSSFGVGWWLAGLATLVANRSDNVLLWVEGDGSTTVFRPKAGYTNRWMADALDGPDSVYWDAGSSLYVRNLPGGGRVVMNGAGKQTSTVSRSGVVTSFEYNGLGELTAIRGDSQGAWSSHLDYIFQYSAEAYLSVIKAPGATPGTTRDVSLGGVPTGMSMAITGFTDPDGATYLFDYDYTTNRMTRVTDPRGSVAVLGYTNRGKRAYSVTRWGGGTASNASDVVRLAVDPRVWVLESGPLDPAGWPGYLKGPRGEEASFWTDRLRQPTQLRDPYGNVTVIERGDIRFPGLVTRVDEPGAGAGNPSVPGAGPRSVELAFYNALGNVDSAKAVNPLGDGINPTTRYVYGNAAWPNFATQVISPGGLVTLSSYDAAGNREWQQVGTDAARRVFYGYNAYGQVTSVQSQRARSAVPAEPAQAIGYDPTLQNLSSVTTPRGYQTLYYTDAAGRDTMVSTPIDTLQTKRQLQVTRYDAMGRDLVVRTFGPAMPTNWQATRNDTLEVRKLYDLAGNLTNVERWSNPDPNTIGHILTTYRYDALGRRKVEEPPQLRQTGVTAVRDSMVFDLAGNPVEVFTTRGLHITMTYDSLGRMKSRVLPPVSYAADWNPRPGWTLPAQAFTIPGDNVTFTYDAAGNLRTAGNAWAQVGRGYFPGGALGTDTLRIRDYAGATFSHVYVTGYQYDLEGRRASLRVPAAVAPVVGGVTKDLIQYAYHPVTGVDSVITGPTGDVFGFHDDADGRLDQYTMPGGIAEQEIYDADGRRRHRTETVSNAYVGYAGYGGWTVGSLHEDGLVFDAGGRVTVDSAWVGGYRDIHNNFYSAMGGLAETSLVFPQTHFSSEWYQADALGNNTLSANDVVLSGGNEMYRKYAYYPQTGQQYYATRLDPAFVVQAGYDDQSYAYDAAGNRTRMVYNYACITGGSCGNKQSATASFYDAENRLRRVERRSCFVDQYGNCYYGNTIPNDMKGGAEEYRYDPLGRRVLVRFASDATCANNCPNHITRTLWDGDQILAEIRAPGRDADAALFESDAPTGTAAAQNQYGRVLYTQGGALDHPLELVRMGINGLQTPTAVIPHANWTGRYDIGSDPQGRSVGGQVCVDPANSATCTSIEWPGNQNDIRFRNLSGNGALATWMGGQVTENQDASGQFYKRNRYYDPVSGQFTQADPIGLAGGINLYGFADGNPLQLSDPYGLMADGCGGPNQPPCPQPHQSATVDNFFRMWSVGVSATAGNVTQSISRDGSVTNSIVRNLPSAGVSGDLTINKPLPAPLGSDQPGRAFSIREESLDFGLGSHSGVSVNYFYNVGPDGKDVGPAIFRGITIHAGVSSPTVPIGVSSAMPNHPGRHMPPNAAQSDGTSWVQRPAIPVCRGEC